MAGPQDEANRPSTEVFDISHLSADKRLGNLLKSVLTEVKLYAEDQIKHIKKLTSIGISLSVEKNISRLLEKIVDEARDLSFADAGTLYILDKEKDHLRFEILQNDSLKTRMGGTSGVPVSLPNVPLNIDGKPNYSNVSSYCALTGKTVNIPDVYVAEGFDFTGPRNYDKSTGYRSKSMLVIPLENHENEIIGVLQLLNAQDPDTLEVIQFSPEYVDLVASLASQAAVALSNTQLIQDLKQLFYSFIKSIATAIDEKSPYTGGHIKRVVDLTILIAEKINQTDKGIMGDISFNKDEIEELRLAAWMHDVGKITTPEYVVDKSTKLEAIFDRIHHIQTRFDLIAQSMENDYLRRKLEILQNGRQNDQDFKNLKKEYEERLKILKNELVFIRSCNNPGEFMDDDKIKRLNAIAAKMFVHENEAHNYLTDNEVKNLCIRKGSLTGEERKFIENHATMTAKILKQLPFKGKLANVPVYASGHHEKIDGSGYPNGLSDSELSLQARIMAIADIFEALTARDRPYKKPMTLSQALKIMKHMADNKHIDADIFDLFQKNKLYLEYARKEMSPEQVDCE
jgi:HD-GYP domain-containing protein (c-di-GMP phosphodiesterase class II)